MALDFAWGAGERVMFLGDAITEDPQGYARLVPTMVTARYPELSIDFTQKGVGGNRIGDLLERLDRDVFGEDPLPTWIVVSIGINDVWHAPTGTPPGRFRELYDALLTRLGATGAKLLCLTTTVIGEELQNAQNTALTPYNVAIRDIGFAHGAEVVDINAVFHEAIARAQSVNPRFRYTTNDVQLNTYGQYLMSLAVLKGLHFPL